MGQKLADTELELYRRVDEVLYYVWDPVGVAPSPITRDEYQRYLPKVFAMLKEGSGVSPIAACLDYIAAEGMGPNGNPEHSKKSC